MQGKQCKSNTKLYPQRLFFIHFYVSTVSAAFLSTYHLKKLTQWFILHIKAIAFMFACQRFV